MIELTRLNGTQYLINPDMLLTVESTPDTVITLTNGDKLMVQEAPGVVTARFIKYKRNILAGLTDMSNKPKV